MVDSLIAKLNVGLPQAQRFVKLVGPVTSGLVRSSQDVLGVNSIYLSTSTNDQLESRIALNLAAISHMMASLGLRASKARSIWSSRHPGSIGAGEAVTLPPAPAILIRETVVLPSAERQHRLVLSGNSLRKVHPAHGNSASPQRSTQCGTSQAGRRSVDCFLQIIHTGKLGLCHPMGQRLHRRDKSHRAEPCTGA